MDTYEMIWSIVIFISIGRTNSFEFLAFKRPVSVSTRYNSEYFSPSNAVDGDRSTELLKCTLTGFDQKEAWLRVDLGSKKNIESISILHGGLGVDASPISSTTSGVLPDNDGAGHVFLVDNGTICGENFGTGDAMVICLIWGFIPDYPSYRKVNMSSRILLNDPECKGDEVSINECPMGGRNCSSGESVSVKCNEGNTFAGFSVYVSDTEDFKSGHACHYHAVEEIPSNTISFPCITSGRYVTIFNSRNATQLPSLSEWAYINICELNVAGCDFGFYGGECSRCPGNCLDDNCHVQTGLCSGCKDGFTGPTCTTECSAGLYGPNCSLTCAQCRDGESCNNINGACPNGCSAGWMGEQCNLKCDYGFFGQECNNSCNIPNCKNSSSCDDVTGACLLGCIDGWTGQICNEKTSDMVTYIIAGSVSSIIFIILVVAVSVTLIHKKPYHKKEESFEKSSANSVKREYDHIAKIRINKKLEANQTCYMDTSIEDIITRSQHVYDEPEF